MINNASASRSWLSQMHRTHLCVVVLGGGGDKNGLVGCPPNSPLIRGTTARFILKTAVVLVDFITSSDLASGSLDFPWGGKKQNEQAAAEKNYGGRCSSDMHEGSN